MDSGGNSYWPLPKRIDYIERIERSPSDITHVMEFQGESKTFRIYKVPIELPVYRLNNGRTLASQQEYLVTKSKPDNFFTRDPESAEALSAQEEILKGMVNDEGLLDYFRSHDQIEPLILTHEGYIVNGNRRLCAFKLLLAENPEEFKKFKHVKVVFLPPCDEQDIDILEAELQIVVDIKAKYGWVDTAMILRNRMRAHNWSVTELASIHGMSEKDINETIGMLDIADQYLEYRKRPREYSIVADKEYAFRPFYKYRAKCKDAATRDAYTQICYKIIDKPPRGDRLYHSIQEAYENLDDIIKTVKEELIDKQKAEQSTEKDNTVTEKPTLGGPLTPFPKFNEQRATIEVVKVIANPHNNEQTSNIIIDVLQKGRQLKQDEKTANYCLKQIANAHSSLQAALNGLTTESNTSGISTNLDNIENIVKQIRAWMKDNAKN